MFRFRFAKSLYLAFVCSTIFLTSVVVAQAQHATDYAIFSTDDVTLETYSVVGGDVYSGRNLTLDFGYGIQDTDLNAGDMFVRGNYLQESLSDVNGFVFVNGDASLEGSAEIHGNLTYGGTYTGDVDDVSGSLQQQSDPVGEIAVPPATEFTVGTNSIVTDEDLVLAPGSYRDVIMTGLFTDLTLTSGDYYMRQLDLQSSINVSLQIIDDQPINVFIEGNADFGRGLDFFVNGVEIGTEAGDAVAELAQLVMYEVHGDVTVVATGVSAFFGTIFAPDGNVTLNVLNMHGSIISGRPVLAEVYLDHQPSQYLTPPLVPVLMGDCNLDGVVNFLDITPFIGILSGDPYLPEADFVDDGVISFLDIAPFIIALSSQ